MAQFFIKRSLLVPPERKEERYDGPRFNVREFMHRWQMKRQGMSGWQLLQEQRQWQYKIEELRRQGWNFFGPSGPFPPFPMM